LADVARAAGELPGVTDLGLLVGERKGAIDLRVEGGVTPGLRKRAEQLLQHRIVAASRWEGPCWGTRW